SATLRGECTHAPSSRAAAAPGRRTHADDPLAPCATCPEYYIQLQKTRLDPNTTTCWRRSEITSSARSSPRSRVPVPATPHHGVIAMRGKRSLCVLLLGLLAPPALRAQGVGQITGVVTSSDVGAPLANATVTVQGTQRGALTADNGRYLILNVPVGEHVVEVQLIGYTTQ